MHIQPYVNLKPLVQNSNPHASVCCSISIWVLPTWQERIKKASAMTKLQHANSIRISEQTVGYGWAWLCQASHNHLIQVNRGCLVSPQARQSPTSGQRIGQHVSLDSYALWLCLKFLDIYSNINIQCRSLRKLMGQQQTDYEIIWNPMICHELPFWLGHQSFLLVLKYPVFVHLRRLRPSATTGVLECTSIGIQPAPKVTPQQSVG